MKIQWWFNQNWPILEHDGSTKHVTLENWKKCIHFQPKKIALKIKSKLKINNSTSTIFLKTGYWVDGGLMIYVIWGCWKMSRNTDGIEWWKHEVGLWCWMMLHHCSVVSFELFSSWWFFTQPIYKNLRYYRQIGWVHLPPSWGVKMRHKFPHLPTSKLVLRCHDGCPGRFGRVTDVPKDLPENYPFQMFGH